ncbi:MAG: hypothetical protein U0359_01520 [Byssovorax sp.]
MFDPEDIKAGSPATRAAPVPPGAPARAGVALDPRRLLVALRRNVRTLAVATLVSAAAGVVAAKTLVKREFEAQIILQWAPEKTTGGEDDARQLKTVLDSVKLPGNLEKVREKLAITSTLESLGQRIDVVSSSESNVVTIKAKANDAEEAAKLADTTSQVFLDNRIEVERRHLLAQVGELEASVAEARAAVSKARSDYDAFRAEHGIADLPAETQAAIEQAAKLRSQADIARAESQAELARAEALRKAALAQQPTTVLNETEVLPDQRKLAEAKAELSTLKAQLSDDHPRVKALEAQIASLEKRIAEAPKAGPAERTVGRNPQWESAKQGLTEANAQREAALKRETAYTELLSSAQAMIDKLSKIEGEASTKLSALRVAEKHLGDLEEQLAKARDASRSPPRTFRVLAPAKVPMIPSKSRRTLVAALGPVIGLLLSSIVVLLRAVRGLRVCTGDELSFWGQGPVLATSPYPREEKALDDLVADLAPWLRASSGTTLLLGLGPGEEPAVDALARRFGLAREEPKAAAPKPEAKGKGGKKKGAPAPAPAPPAAAPAPPSPRRADAPALITLPSTTAAPALRRAAREADRVLVLVRSGEHSALGFSSLPVRLGRSDKIGFVLLGIGQELLSLADRVGDVDAFWERSEPPRASGRPEAPMATPERARS